MLHRSVFAIAVVLVAATGVACTVGEAPISDDDSGDTPDARIVNGVDAMNGGGTLVVASGLRDDCVEIVVSDTGHGIPEEIHSTVFEPFFTTKPPGSGTGMGLNISHNIIVQRHKGRIDVYSKPGQTRFEVRLPLVSMTIGVTQLTD